MKRTKKRNRNRPAKNMSVRNVNFRLNPITAFIRTSLPAGLLFGLHVGSVYAGPEGGVVAAGEGSISTPNATTTNINQVSQNLILNWQSFNINANEVVNFDQPNAQAQALNRIFDQNPSQIYGQLNANGRVLLVNPNGVFFKPGASVNVGGLTASGLDISNESFMSGNHQFFNQDGSEGGMVVNQGIINAATGGSVNLIGGAVINEGTILATAGQVNLVAGKKVTMDFDGDGLMQFTVDEEILQNVHDLDDAISNTGTINADGGTVLLKGAAAKDVFTNVVNNSGMIGANKISNEGGVIKLVASGTSNSLINTGTLNASSSDSDGGTIEIFASDTTIISEDALITAASSSGTGGYIEITGDRVGLFDSTTINASGETGGGEILVGGDLQGSNPDVHNAYITYVGEDVVINADAIDEGDGGKAIVWADDTTRFYGHISARGGQQSGNGGFAEVSGKRALVFEGTSNLSAPNGELGTLLLDPGNITIGGVDGGLDGSTGSEADPFEPTAAGGANISTVTLLGVLNTGNAHVLATASGGDLGDLTVDALIQPGAGGGDLTLQAQNNIILTNNADIDFQTNNSAGNLVLFADSDGAGGAGDGTGNITQLTNGVKIRMGTGALQMTAGDGIGTSGQAIEVDGLTSVAATTDTGGIFITNDGSTNVTVDEVTTGVLGTTTGLTATTSGNIQIINDGANIIVDEQVNATSGNVTLSNTTNVGTGTVTVNDDVIAGGTGTIDIIGQDGITIDDATVQANNNTINIDADSDNDNTGTFTTQGTAPQVLATTNDNTITITAAEVTLGAGTLIDNDNGIINLIPSNTNRTIALGSGALNFTIDDTEIDFFGDGADTPTINIGSNHNATVTIDTFTPTRAINLVIDADGGSSGIVNVSNAASTFADNANLTINVTDGGVNINQDLTLGAGGVGVPSGTGALDINATGGTVTIGGAVTVGSGGVSIDPANAPGTVDINSNIITNGNIQIDALDNITIDATVQTTGTGTTLNVVANSGIADGIGNITIGGAAVATVESNDGQLTLTGENIIIGNSGNASTVRTVGGGAIDINVDANNNMAGDLTIGANGTLNTITAGTGNITIDNANNVTFTAGATISSLGSFAIGGANDVTGTVNIDAGITAGTSLTINSDGSIDIDNATLTASNGTLTLNADDEQNGTGDLTIAGAGAATLDSSGNNQNIVLFGDSVSVGTGAAASLNAGTGNIELHVDMNDAGGGGIRIDQVNTTMTFQDFTIDAADAPDTLIISDTEAANTISAEDLNSATGNVILRANTTTTVNTAISVAGSLTIDQATTADINANLTAGTSLNVSNTTNLNIDASAARALIANNGNLDFTGATTTTLDGGSNTVTLESNGGNVLLGNIVDDAAGGDAADLTITSQGSVTTGTINLDDVTTDGTLNITVDDNNDGTETLTVGGAITNVASAAFSGGATANDVIDINADITTTAGAITVQNANQVQLDASVARTLTAAGDITMTANVNGVQLNNGSSLVTLTTSNDGNVALAAVTDDGVGATAADLTITSQGDVTLSTVSLNDTTDGTLNVTVDSDDNDAEVETLTLNGAITNVNDITLSGGFTAASDDIIDINADITTTAAGLTIQDAATVDLAADVDLLAAGGTGVTASSNVVGIVLSGTGTNIITSFGDAAVDLAAVTDSANAGLTVSSQGDVTLAGVVLNDAGGSLLQVTADSDNDGTHTLQVNGTLSSDGAVTLAGGATANDTIDINADITTTGGAITIQNASQVQLDASAARTLTSFADLSITTNVGGIQLNNGSSLVTLTNTNNGDISIAGVTDDGAGGTAADLTITSGGGVTLSTVDLNDTTDGTLIVTADSNDNGTEILTVGGAITNVAAATLSGGGTGTSDVIDINADITTTAGALTVQNASSVLVDASAARALTSNGGNLAMDSNVTAITLDNGSNTVTFEANGGNATFANIADDASGTNAADLTITSQGGVTIGTISLDDTTTDGTLSITVDDNDDGTETLTVGGAITNVAAATLSGGTTVNDVIDINADITTTAGALTVQNASSVLVDASAARALTSNGGNLAMDSNVTAITLDNGSNTVTFDANGGNATFANIADDASGTNSASLTINSEGGVTAGTIILDDTTTDGDLTIRVDNNNDGSETLSVTGAITGDEINIQGSGARNETMTFDGLITSTQSVLIANANTVDLNAGITAGTTIAVDTTNTTNAAGGTTIQTTNGAIDLRSGVTTGFNVTGAGLLTIDGNGGGLVQIADITDSANASLTVNADGALNISSVNMNGTGTFTANVGITGDSQAQFFGTVSADTVTLTGTGSNDDLILTDTLTSLDGNIDINTFDQVDAQNIIATNGNLTVSATNIDLNNTTYTSTTGLVTFTGVVDLDAGAGPVTVTSGGGTGDDITFTSTIDELGTTSDLTLNAGTDGDVSLQAVGVTNQIGALTITGNDISFNGNVESGAINVTAQEGAADADSITIGAVTLDANANDMVFRSDDIIINAAANLTSTGGATSVAFAGETDATTIGIGAGSTGILNLTEAELNRVDSTFTEIIVGNDTNQSGTINVNDSGGDNIVTISNTGLRLRVEAGGDVDIDNELVINNTDSNLTIETNEAAGTSTLLAGDITTRGGDVLINGTVLVDGNRTIDSGLGSPTTAGLIRITDAIGAEGTGDDVLTLTASGTANGDVDIQSTVGSGTVNSLAANDLTAFIISNAAQVDLNNIEVTGTASTAGVIDISGSNIDLNGATYTVTSGALADAITFRAAVDLHNNVVITGGGVAGDTVSFNSTINADDATTNDRSLQIVGGAADVTVTGAIGGTQALEGGVNIAGATIGTSAITTSSADTNEAAGAVTLAATGGTVTVGGAINAVGNGTGGGGTVTIDANGTNAVSVQAINASGGGTTDTGANIVLNDGGGTGTLTLNGDLTSTGATSGGAITLGSATELGATPITITTGSTGGDITFDSTVNSSAGTNRALTLTAGTANVTLSGDAGGTAGAELLSFNVTTANNVSLQNVTTDTGAITLGTNATTRLDGTLTLNGNLISHDGTNGAGAISLFADNIRLVGAGPGTIALNSNGSTDAAITIDTTSGSLESATAWLDGLTLDAGTSTIDVTGATITNLDHLDVTAASFALGDTTVGDGAGNAGVALDINTTGNLTLNGDITSNDATSTNAGAIDFSGVSGAILLNGGGAVDATTVTITTDAAGTDANINLGAVQDSGVGGFNLAVDAGTADVTLSTVGTGADAIGTLIVDGNDIAFNGNVESTTITATAVQSGGDNDSITIGAVTLDANGSNMVLRSDDIAINATANLTSTGGATSVTFAGETDATTIGLGDQGNALTATLNLSEAELNRIDSTFTETIIGVDTTQSGSIFVDESGGLAISNTGLRLRVEAAAGDVDIDSDITLANADSAFTIEGAGVADTTSTLLSGNITTNNGNIVIGNTILVDGVRTLDSSSSGAGTAGFIQIDGQIGSVDTAGDTLTLDADAVTDGAVNVVANIGDAGTNVNGAAANDLTGFTVVGNQVDLANVEVTSGNIAITGTDINLNGSTYQTTTSGSATFTGAVDLTQAGGTTTVQTAGGAGDNITFSSTINDDVNGNTALTLNAGANGNVSTGNIGGSIRPGTVDIDGATINIGDITVEAANILVTGTTINLNGSYNANTSGLMTFTGPVNLTASGGVSFTTAGGAGDDISFTSTVDDNAAGDSGVTINAGAAGDVTISGALGGTTRVGNTDIDGLVINVDSIRVDGAGAAANIFVGTLGTTTTLNLNGANYDSINSPTSGTILFDGPVTLNQTGGTTTISTTSGANSDITFRGTVDDVASDTALVVDTGTVGDINFQQAVGGTNAIQSLTITNANQLDAVNVRTTGAQSYTATNIDLNGTTYQSTGSGVISFTGPVDLVNNGITITTAGAGGDNISFSSTIDSDDAESLSGDRSISLVAGAGDVTVTGAIGGTESVDGGVTISGATINTNAITTDGADTGANKAGGAITIDATGGTITVGGAISSVGKGLSAGGAVDIDANLTNAISVQAITTNSAGGGGGGIIELNNDAVGTGIVTLNGDLTSGTTSAGGGITLGTATELATNINISTGTNVGDINFDSTLDSVASGNNTLGLTAGTGSITFTGAVGSGVNQELGATTVNSANNVTVTSTLEAASFTQSAGTGTSQFGGQVDTTAAGTNVSITTDTIDLNDNINTNGGNVVLSAASGITLDGGNIVTTGVLNAADTTDNAGTVDIDVTAAGNVAFTGNIVTTGAASNASAAGDGGQVNIDTFDGSITVADITASGGVGTGQNGGNAANILLTAGDNGGSNGDNISIGTLTTLGGAGTAAGANGNVTLTAAAGNITDGNGVTNNVSAALLTIDARDGVASGTTLETIVTSLDVDNTNSNNIDISNASTAAVTVTKINNAAATGTINYTQTGNSQATLTDIDTVNGDITIVVNGGAGANVLIGAINADTTDDTVSITSTGSINDASTDTTTDITARTITFSAATGIGNSQQVETNSAAQTATSTNGNIDIDNTAITGVTTVITNLQTGTGTINFDQNGNEALTINAASTTSGDITIRNTGDAAGDTLTIGGAIAAAAADTITISSLGRGNIAVNNTITTANGGTITLNSSNDITIGAFAINSGAAAGTINLNVDTNNDVAATLDLGGSTLTANSINFDGGADTTAAVRDTLVAQNVTNTFTLNAGDDDGTLGNASLSSDANFTDFHNLTGNAGADNFAFTGGSLTGNITAAAGTNTLDYSGLAGPIAVTLDSVGANGFDIAANGASQVTGTITGITNLTGSAASGSGAAGDTLTGINDAATWTIQAGNETYLSTNTLTITDGTVENFTGNANIDTFNVSANHTGNLDGQANNDAFNLSGTAVVTGNLVGDAGNDTFDFDGTSSVIGNVNGGTGSDTIDFNGSTLAQRVSITGSGANGQSGTIVDDPGQNTPPNTDLMTAGFTDINILTGNNISSLIGQNVDTFWNITGANSGTYGTSLALIGTNTFNNFSIVGGTANDTFIFQNNATAAIAGGIDGGTGTNTLAGSLGVDAFVITGANAVTITPTGGAGATNLTNITNIDGTNATDDGTTTVGDTGADTFAINQNWTGSLNGSGGNDTFTFADTRTVGGSITGGAGTDILNWNAYTTARSVTLTSSAANGFSGTEASITGGFVTIDDVRGSTTGGQTDLLTGQNATATFTVNGGGTQYSTGGFNLAFSDFENLTGGTGADTFNVTGAHSGDLSGGDGADVFTVGAVLTGSIDAGSDADTITLNNNVTGTVTGGAGTDTINYNAGTIGTLTGGADSDTIVGENDANAWVTTGADAGTLDGQAFSAIENWTGGTAVDTFTLGHNVTGTVTGSAGADIFNYNAGTIGTLTGGADNDTIIGENDANAWVTTGADAGTLDGQAFTSMENLTGGTAVDTFTLGHNITGTVDGAAGDDVINYNAGTIGTLTGGANNDTIVGENDANTWITSAADAGSLDGQAFTAVENWTGGSAVDTFTINHSVSGTVTGSAGADIINYNAGTIGTLTGGADTDTIVGENDINTWNSTATDAGTLDGQAFSAVENWTGGTAADTFTLGHVVTGLIDGVSNGDGDVANFTAGQTVTVNGTNTGVSNIETIDMGGGGILVGSAAANTWLLDDGTAGGSGRISVGGFNIDFQNTPTIQTGTGADTFTNPAGGGTYTGNIVINESVDNRWNYTAGQSLTSGAVTGTGALQISGTAGAAVTINAADLNLPTLTGFTGHLVIGGQVLDGGTGGTTPQLLYDPVIDAAGEIVITANTITVDAAGVNAGGTISFLAGDIFLNGDITAGTTLAFLAGGDQVQAGTTGVIDASAGAVTLNVPISTDPPSAVFIATDDVVSADNILLNFGGGEVDVAVGNTDAVEFSGASIVSDTTTNPDFEAFVNNLAILGLTTSFTINNVVIINPASALIGLETLAFIDLGLFEEELQLYGTIGTGIALSLAQCEEQEGCAPSVTEDELNTLIASLEARLLELERRLVAEPELDLRAELEKLIDGFNIELLAFQSYKKDLEAFFAAEDDFGDDDFADEDLPEEGELTLEPDVDSVAVLAKVLETVNRRIEWLESLKGNPDERARLSKATGIELTLEALDTIIEAAKAEAGFIENRIRLLIEGKEAMLDVPEVFTAEVRDFSSMQTLHYGSDLLYLDNAISPEKLLNIH